MYEQEAVPSRRIALCDIIKHINIMAVPIILLYAGIITGPR